MSDVKEVLTDGELAVVLKCSVKTIRQKIYKGEIRAQKIGIGYRIHRDAVRDYLFRKAA